MKSFTKNLYIPRRKFLQLATTAGSGALAGCVAPDISYSSQRPIMSYGIQAGDVSQSSAVVWSAIDRPGLMHVEVSASESFKDAQRFAPVAASVATGYAAKCLLTGLPQGQQLFYRVHFSAFGQPRAKSPIANGSFRTAPDALAERSKNIRFAWSGDTAGQGWGIDPAHGGMATYSTMRKHSPDFMIHSGDTIYADGPIKSEQKMNDGTVWRNLVSDGVHKVAESLEEYRGRWRYNLHDKHLRQFNSQVPVYYQWDDHEVLNNWSPGKDLSSDARYAEKSIDLLAGRARRAFHEMLPTRQHAKEPGRIYRKISYGPLLEVFMLDLRSYRGANTAGDEAEISPESRIFGAVQMAWFEKAVLESKATWKVIASDMPLGLVVWDNYRTASGVEGVANGINGVPLGRELELAKLLKKLKQHDVQNVVWLTADVHYTAAHHYHPDRAAFKEFSPFWEFVSGPLHAGTFGQAPLDDTFGPEVKFAKTPTAEQGVNLPPSAGLQFFGLVDIDHIDQSLTVRLMDRGDKELYRKVLTPKSGGQVALLDK
jgi:alkaline phosphatase D